MVQRRDVINVYQSTTSYICLPICACKLADAEMIGTRHIRATMFLHSCLLKYLLLIVALFLFDTALAETCNHMKTCEDCVQKTSWSGHSCRWCKRDNECHAYASAKNPCKRTENIVSLADCGREFSTYEPDLSFKMLLLSSAAYDPYDPQSCLQNALRDSNFEIKRIVTKNCDILDNECLGFVAISHIDKAIALVFRGSKDIAQALVVLVEGLASPKTSFLNGKVQTFWNRGFSELWPCMEEEIVSLLSQYTGYKLWISGHSLGGAIASLASTYIAYHNIAPRKDIILYTFGMPRVGNYNHAYQHDELVRNSWRVVNYCDPVPHFPSLASILVVNGPYHHGIEAYYSDVAVSPQSPHKECHAKPYNEDATCSFTVPQFNYDIDHHKTYFSIPVGTFWKKECKAGNVKRRRRETTNTTNTKFAYLRDRCSVFKYKNETIVQVRKSAVATSSSTSANWFFVISTATIHSIHVICSMSWKQR